MSDDLIGLHSFVCFEGDAEYNDCERLLNPILWESPVYKNLIVTSGKNAYLDRLAGLSSVGAFTTLGVGTDSTAASVGQTQLNPSVSGSVLIQNPDSTYPSRASNVLTIKSTFGTGVANFNWNEAGFFNGLSNGTAIMFNRVIIGPFTKTSTVSIAYTTTITQS